MKLETNCLHVGPDVFSFVYLASSDTSFTVLLAGDDTVASQLCWIVNQLASKPDVQHRIRKELEVFPLDVMPTYSDILGLSRQSLELYLFRSPV